jgi:hypothetical protein
MEAQSGIPQLHPPAYSDWIVTATFYVALHTVDSLLEFDNVDRVHSHETRNCVLTGTNRYMVIWRTYQPLHDLSRKIRYMADPQEWVPPSLIDKQVLRRYLYPIEKSVKNLMPVPIDLPEIVIAGITSAPQ